MPPDDLFSSSTTPAPESAAPAPANVPPAGGAGDGHDGDNGGVPPGPVAFDTLGDDGTLPIQAFAEQQFLAYAMSIVVGRAIPFVEDGNKPVHRRIYYAMYRLGLSGGKHVKSARVVGDVMGKLHPHGDSSIYDAMVRMAQDFSVRYPLIDGQGNFGSRDGDNPAAMRYTECRLTPIADLLLSEIDRGTVDFIPNYDGKESEPQYLPARLPFILLNGASGIAVGMATEVPSHNLREVAAATLMLIRRPDATLADLMTVLPAPDFANGGQITSPPSAIAEAYETGRGSLRMRARWKREELARGQWRIAITEMPHGVSTAIVLKEIEQATNPTLKAGRKELSQDQKNLKNLLTSMIDGARDEADKDSPVRLVIEPKSSRQSEDELMAALLAHTSLQCNVPVNLTVLGRDGRALRKSLRQILLEWIDFRFVTVRRRISFRLDEVRRRLHILDGRMIAFLRIEEVIRTIRESDEPKPALIAAFGLSDIQAEDILEIRLRQLARLEGFKIEKELEQLRDEGKGLQHLLDTPTAFRRAIEKEIEADTKKFGDDRRTLIEVVEQARPAEIRVSDEPVTLILSANGWARTRLGHGVDPATIAYKQGDHAGYVIETRTIWPLVLVDDKGRAYSVRVADIPGGRGDGVPITTMIDLQDGGRVAHALSADPETQYLFANSSGYGFITRLKELVGRAKAGKEFMRTDGAAVLPPAVVTDLDGSIGACSHGPKESRLLVFPTSEVKVMTKGLGVILMALKPGERLAAIGPVATDIVRVRTASAATPLVIKGADLERFRGHRARAGCQIGKRAMPVAVS